MAKRGRPTKVNNFINKKEVISLMYERGFTDAEVAKVLDVTRKTLDNWKHTNEDFLRTLKTAKSKADDKVEKSLYQRAIGYKYDEVTYEKSKVGGLGVKLNDGEIENIKQCGTSKVKVVTKEVVPDVTAQIFWLKNRKPKAWRDKHELEQNLNVNINQEEKAERFTRLQNIFAGRN